MSFISFHPVYRDLQRLSDKLDAVAAPSGSRREVASVLFGSGQFTPRIDLSETDKGYVLHADVPGVNKNEIDVSVKDNILTISGERSKSTDIGDDQRHLVERLFGKFSRSLRLPNDANSDKVTASLENGVLELVFPKKPLDEGVRKISVQ
ncbi:hypothetical protein HDU84_000144 [Entophlyctis sp. JEL0112]|nr:hypothetical protein HDU84_000144 [Entophlyctis sp. JEL0112]